MLTEWLKERNHKKHLRELEREKELMQALCLHKYEYMGTVDVEWYSGIDFDFTTYYQARCSECHKTVRDHFYSNLKTICGLKD